MLGLASILALLFGLILGGEVIQAGQKKPLDGMTALSGEAHQPAKFVPGEVLVKFRDEASSSAIKSLNMDVGAQEVSVLSVNAGVIHQYKLEGALSVEEAVSKYRSHPAVEYAEPNYLHWLKAMPNDAQFGTLWGLHNTGQDVNGTAGTADADIDAPEAWDINTGSPNVTVAVIDSGIAYDHPDLGPNIWTNPGEIPGNGVDDDGNGLVDDVRGWDFSMNDSDPMDPVDFNNPDGNPGHGTHVAGTIAGAGNNGTGVTGVMWTARLMALKAGGVGGLPTFAIVSAVQYAVAKGARVINASYGGPDCSLAEYDAVSAANAAGVLFVAAAGNDGEDNDSVPSFPANFSAPSVCGGQQKAALANVIAVAATDQNDQLASFSNFGSTTVQVAAPGVRINSTKPTSNVTNVLFHSFDSNPTALGYTSGGTNNTWGFTSAASFSSPNSLADSPAGNYLNNTNSFVIGPVFSTAGQRGCRFDSRVRLQTEPDLDGVLVETSRNSGTTWQTINAVSGSTNAQFVGFTWGDIADGVVSSRFRLRFVSDESVVFDGVYVDNVRIACVAGAPSGSTDYQFLQGTSMATPHVAGLAGLLLSANPNLTVTQLKNAILNTVDRKAALSGKVSTGGRINARAALASVVANFTVTVNKVGTGTGTVTSNPSGIDCGVTCNGQFPQGGTVILSAAPSPGSVFAGWSGSCGGAGACSLTTNSTVTATFNIAPPPSDGGGGGCVLMPGGTGDALLPALLIAALAAWLWRARRTRN
ncbi:S8 family serine peptidase [Nitrospira tepida]|uniref:S8 family serine peptidase n=1 Tax=Nitrospira tepida TaxID=2973512 RepID=UPI00259C8A98|nr:S8 family serine peptidase [Nitrospira tepida]